MNIKQNYVLIKPDDDFETYQLGGKETGIIAPLVFKDEKNNEISAKQQHISISGTVHQIPDKLVFNGYKIWELQDKFSPRRDTGTTREPSVQKEIDELRLNSVRFDAEMEAQAGDKVWFEYTAHMMANTYSRWITIDDNRMMFIKYDDLILAKRKEQIIMLNGYMIIQNDMVESKKERISFGGNVDRNESSWEVDGEEVGGIFVVHQQPKVKKTRSHAFAKILHSGTKVNAYLELRGIKDGNSTGTNILYDPRHAKELEFGLHRIFDGERLLRIQRKDIYGRFE